eukprot:3557228-Pleurochrysis_carterae.AAC.3
MTMFEIFIFDDTLVSSLSLALALAVRVCVYSQSWQRWPSGRLAAKPGACTELWSRCAAVPTPPDVVA